MPVGYLNVSDEYQAVALHLFATATAKISSGSTKVRAQRIISLILRSDINLKF